MSVRTKTMSVQFRNIRLEWRPVSALKPNPRNARIHSKKQIHQIAQSIIQFGFINPVLTDGNDNIKVGHGRFEAAKELGLDVIPTICIGHLSEAQIRAYAIADNKLALKAGWDLEILAVEFQELSALDLPFDLEITGFETAEIDEKSARGSFLPIRPTTCRLKDMSEVSARSDIAISRWLAVR